VRWELSRGAGVIDLAAVDHLGAAGAASVGLGPSLKVRSLKVRRPKVGRPKVGRPKVGKLKVGRRANRA